MDFLPAQVLLPVLVLARLFRRLFLDYLRKAFDAGDLQFFSSLESLRMRDAFLRHIAPIQKKDWVVYPKRPFAGPEQVLKYVARYTHRIAISNNRLLDIDDGKVQFRWKDYRNGHCQKTMTRRIHPSVLASCTSRRVSTYSVFRPPGQSLPRREARSVPAAHANVAANGHPQSQHGLQRSI
jgi:hypothetical protein